VLSVCLTHLYFSGFSSQVIFKNLLRSVSTIVKIIFVFNDAEHVVLDKFFRSRFWHFKKNLNQYFFLGKLLFKFEPFLFLLRFRPMKQGLANLAAETYPLSWSFLGRVPRLSHQTNFIYENQENFKITNLFQFINNIIKINICLIKSFFWWKMKRLRCRRIMVW